MTSWSNDMIESSFSFLARRIGRRGRICTSGRMVPTWSYWGRLLLKNLCVAVDWNFGKSDTKKGTRFEGKGMKKSYSKNRKHEYKCAEFTSHSYTCSTNKIRYLSNSLLCYEALEIWSRRIVPKKSTEFITLLHWDRQSISVIQRYGVKSLERSLNLRMDVSFQAQFVKYD